MAPNGPLSPIGTFVKLWLVLHVLRRDAQPLCVTFHANKTGKIISPRQKAVWDAMY